MVPVPQGSWRPIVSWPAPGYTPSWPQEKLISLLVLEVECSQFLRGGGVWLEYGENLWFDMCNRSFIMLQNSDVTKQCANTVVVIIMFFTLCHGHLAFVWKAMMIDNKRNITGIRTGIRTVITYKNLNQNLDGSSANQILSPFPLLLSFPFNCGLSRSSMGWDHSQTTAILSSMRQVLMFRVLRKIIEPNHATFFGLTWRKKSL